MIYETLTPHLETINLFTCEKEFATKERFTNNHYFLYVHSGTGKFIIDSTTYEGNEGDLFFCPMLLGNTIIASIDNPFVLSGIDFFFWEEEMYLVERTDERIENRIESPDSAAPDNFDIELAKSEIIKFFPPKTNILSNHFSIFLIQEMIDSFTNKTIHSQYYCNTLLKSFIIKQIQIYEISKGQGSIKYQEILKYLAENQDVFISIKDISKIFNYHPNTINRIVRETTGMSVKEYQIDLRINKAMNLLLYSNKSIAEIAALCGYQNIFFFSRQFRDKTSLTPTKFREGSKK